MIHQSKRKKVSGSRPRGFALLAAMIVLVTVATISVGMLWMQWQMVRGQSYQNARLEADYLLNGLQAVAQLLLKEDAKKTGGQVVALNGAWAIPLEKVPLDMVLKAAHLKEAISLGRMNSTTVSLAITDAQGRLNLAGLVSTDPNFMANVQNFTRLFQILSLPKSDLDKIIQKLNTRTDSDSTVIPIMPQTVRDLAWLGIDAKVTKTLAPYVVLLSGGGLPINVNTASSKVLFATVLGLTESGVQQLIDRRKVKPFASLAEAAAVVQAPALNNGNLFSVNSGFFLVKAEVSYKGVTSERNALLREQQGSIAPVWSRTIPVFPKEDDNDKQN